MLDYERCWTSHPHEWQPLLEAWQARHPQLQVDVWPQYAPPGHAPPRVMAATLGADGVEKPFRLLVAVPHGHEPAGTAACVDLLSELLEGRHRDGSPSDLDRERLLPRLLITVIPDANPQGRARSPERVWDGERYANDAFLKIAFGIAADGERFGRYPEWRFAEHQPQQIGIVYEQLDADLYGEPNTNRRCTHTRAVDTLFRRYRYTHFLDMHQHEGDEAALLPAEFDELPAVVQAKIDRWARRLLAAWHAAGATPKPEPYLPYRGQTRQQFFKDYWAGRCPGMLRLTCEVRNNRHARTGEPTPLAHQFRMAQAALRGTLELAAEAGI